MLNIAALRHRRTWMRHTTTPDGRGGFTEGEKALAKISCRVRPIRGMERDRAGSTAGVVTHEVTMRHHSTHTPRAGDWLVGGGQRLNVVAALQDEQSRFWKLDCKEVTA